LRRTGAAWVNDIEPCAVVDPLQHMVKKDRMCFTGVGPPQENEIGLLISLYELVPPPAPKTAARPATLGACHVRLQLSMLLLPMTSRANFWAIKLISFVALEQLNSPNV
jgi:hypothetical protein